MVQNGCYSHYEVVIGEMLLYQYHGCLHYTGSMCMVPLIHSDLRMLLIFPEISS